ncbi:GNAT family N-acetyltransferase [Leuconostoc falkenbergense]|uniref:GNAT family N-acetyltransferase n=1 Tax=Leuconostoc falkenbergense TaxID=2766470 RepID=UPI0024AE6307|nr:GNAT family N-acetyltransferase [Leuconostoc falkenbergense]MDI6666729.1 GNAT family N-acetyltransferase [Leuconostoc falkenbergense]
MQIIRKANQSDLLALATINTINWRETYADILPDEYLNTLSVSEIQKKWQTFIDSPVTTLQVVEIDNEIAGFVATSDDDQIENATYVDALHISNRFQRKGLGTKLLNKVLEEAHKHNKRVTIAILKGNENARNLYTKLGAVHLEDFTDHFGSVVTKSERLIW